ncbi:MAG: hypothetical protein F6K17_10925 [Okeania sp. SIO3C4]|nr:hypothetical protein [Okeania sp. SIO3C4]
MKKNVEMFYGISLQEFQQKLIYLLEMSFVFVKFSDRQLKSLNFWSRILLLIIKSSFKAKIRQEEQSINLNYQTSN